MSTWTRYYHSTDNNLDGLWLARLTDGAIRLGTFYCGEFVIDCFPYNKTAGVIREITHIQEVHPPEIKKSK